MYRDPHIRSNHILSVPRYEFKGGVFELYPGEHYLNILDYGVRTCEELFFCRECSVYGMFTLCFPKSMSGRVDLLESNWCISLCLEGWLRSISIVRPRYVWVRERVGGDLQHYHLGVWVDESVCRSMYGIGESLQYHWSRALGELAVGCVEYSSAERGKVMLRRGDSSSMHACVYAYSYLSKTYSKEEIAGVRRWGHGL